MMIKIDFKSTILTVIMALASWAPLSQATVIIGNYSATNGIGNTLISASTGTTIKATGFTMNAGTDFLLDSVKLQLNIGANSDPKVSIYSNSAANTPDSVLTVLTDPILNTFNTNTDHVFTPASPFTLFGGSSYWLVVQNIGSDALTWRANSPVVIPTGSEASTLGYKFGNGGGAATAASTIRNSFEITGTAIAANAVPEPMTSLLVASGLLAGSFIRRRN